MSLIWLLCRALVLLVPSGLPGSLSCPACSAWSPGLVAMPTCRAPLAALLALEQTSWSGIRMLDISAQATCMCCCVEEYCGPSGGRRAVHTSRSLGETGMNRRRCGLHAASVSSESSCRDSGTCQSAIYAVSVIECSTAYIPLTQLGCARVMNNYKLRGLRRTGMPCMRRN